MSGFKPFSGLFCAALAASAAAGSAAAQDVIYLDTLTILATRSNEQPTQTMAGVSVVTSEKVDEILPSRFSDVLAGVPGVWTMTNADDPGTSINLRGLQDFGRVAVIVDGARQNFQVSEHGGQGKFYFEPEFLSQVDIARGPVSNIYGSGAIGGVVSIGTKEVEDILVGNDRYGAALKGLVGSNDANLLGSAIFAARPNENFEALVGVAHRQEDDYADGNGDTVVNSGEEMTSELAKLTFRPADGHEIKLGISNLDTSFKSGQPDYDPYGSGVEYDNDVQTTTGTAKYTFASPDNPLIDFALSGYWTRTRQDSTVTDRYVINAFPPPPGFEDTCFAYCADFTGPIGTESYYEINTVGFDVNNTSRFDAFGWQHTVTYGGDYFDDDVETGGDEFGLDYIEEEGYKSTPGGERQAGGAFVQWLAERGTWLDIIGALRYDSFHMESEGNETDGDRLSPKITVGITPFDGFTIYGLYAEGYRAPAVTEAFVNGFHPGAFFQYLPNPDLRPETGHTWEAGINYSRDGLFTEGDTLRLKANAFLNNVDDFIDFQDLSGDPDCDYEVEPGVFSCYGYVNVAKARIKGVEFEGTYDAGGWFFGASATVLEGKDVDTDEDLYSVLPAQVMLTAGARFFDRKLTIAPNWRYAKPGDDDDDDTDPYNLFGLLVAYQPNERTTASLVVDNIFDAQYTPYLQNLPSPGLTVKGALEIKLGVE
jgi:hemoglobin/transferrin/lactoferrin receptor protein